MCGIAGFVNNNVNTFDNQVISRMLNVLKKRGPEGTSWLQHDVNGKIEWLSENESQGSSNVRLALGCSRLAINDTSKRGLQPIANEKRDIWVVLNGEIFNFIELKNELENKGYKFKTRTDTEVIAHSFDAWGLQCFNKFNGQYGIAIYDIKSNKLILARDRLGITPLFFQQNKNGLVFGSEIKAIMQSPGTFSEPDFEQIASIIGLPYKLHGDQGNTLYKNIKKVLPAEYIIYDCENNKINRHLYWNPNDIVELGLNSYIQSRDYLRELLIDSVKIRLRTDRQLAFIVSGGIDSTSVLGIANKLFDIEPVTFSLDLPDERFNENDSIKEVLANLDIENNFIPVTAEDVVSNLSEITNYVDEPLATPNAILHNILAKAIDSSGVKVILNGVGGDEGFLGYHDHFLYFLRSLKITKNPRFNREFYKWQILQNRSAALLDEFCNYVDLDSDRFSPDFLARSKGFDYRQCLNEEFRRTSLNNSLLKKIDFTPKEKQIADMTKFTLPYSLKMDDNCYLSHAVETRQPFLDHRLIEFGLSIPEGYKIRDSVSKFILRQAVRDFIPSSRRRDVRKIGLNLPIDIWMRKQLRNWVNDHLSINDNPIFRYADFSIIQKTIKDHFDGTANHSLKIWDLCCLNEWLCKNTGHVKAV